ncbi:MAG: DUF488 domain-containing protein [Candidatus Competibacter sp.]|nr:DUF488 domain-containing protein [Candidatus Competibacter sp.]MDG4605924.1 DUF488 domain-containing protein [Candidatus Contendobacter sp.]HRD49328.1 DUF488 domain-containing protein [Candidatus Contendobacter sp.]
MMVFTIGFTKKTAEQFFTRLKQPGLLRLIDVRLNNVSQLAGFAKRDDLRFFLQHICGIDYIHAPALAPTKDLLNEYKKNGGDWASYERKFLNLMTERRIEKNMLTTVIDGGCLLCSEATPEHCHRRLVAEYLRDQWHDLEIKHL